jgi:hypothetical protein
MSQANADTQKAFVRQKLYLSMIAASHDIARAVLPVFFSSPQKRMKHLGSCVLVVIRGVPALLTAAHIIDDASKGTLWLGAGSNLIRIDGEGLITPKINGSRDQDRFDFAVLPLSAEALPLLSTARFIAENEMLAPGQEQSGPAAMAFGFPHSKNRWADHAHRRVRTKRYCYGATLIRDEKFANKLGVSGDDHFFMKYEKKSRDPLGTIVSAVSPVGMSGGGLFDLGNLVSGKHFKLVGVIIEVYKSDSRMVFTRMDRVLGAIAQKPHLLVQPNSETTPQSEPC